MCCPITQWNLISEAVQEPCDPGLATVWAIGLSLRISWWPLTLFPPQTNLLRRKSEVSLHYEYAACSDVLEAAS